MICGGVTAAILLAGALSSLDVAAAQEKLTLKATPKTVAWGYYDAKATPVLRIKSGDIVEIQTLITNSPKRLEDAGVPSEQIYQVGPCTSCAEDEFFSYRRDGIPTGRQISFIGWEA